MAKPAKNHDDTRVLAPLRRCLLVEDSVLDQHRVARMIKSVAPIDLTIAGTLAEAAVILDRQFFDFLLLDNALPDGLGVDFAIGLRQRARLRRVPIMIVSDFPSPFMYDKALLARVSPVLTKSELRPRHIRKMLDTCGQSRVTPTRD